MGSELWLLVCADGVRSAKRLASDCLCLYVYCALACGVVEAVALMHGQRRVSGVWCWYRYGDVR